MGRTENCNWAVERKIWKLVAEEERNFTARYFSTYGCPLDMVTSFRYLGRVILAADDDWPVVVRNLSQARSVWRRMTRILIREGKVPRVSGLFFKAMVPVVLIFGSETLVVTPRMVKSLGGFQAQVMKRLTVHLPWRTPDVNWTHNLA